MSAFEKEKVFTVLREYHMKKFSTKSAGKEIDDLRAEFIELEDSIISMILSFVNGKSDFTDESEKLAAFEKKLAAKSASVRLDETDKNLFAEKIQKLRGLLELAKGMTFKLRKVKAVPPKKV